MSEFPSALKSGGDIFNCNHTNLSVGFCFVIEKLTFF